MQALKLGFARRILAEQRRRRHPLQAELFAHAPPHIWQRRFYDFNVWSSRKRAEKLRYIASQSSKTRVGQISGAMALEQLPCLRGGRAGSGERERVASVETEDPPSGSVKLMMPAVSRPTSRKARDVGHPRLFLGSPPPITWATRPRLFDSGWWKCRYKSSSNLSTLGRSPKWRESKTWQTS